MPGELSAALDRYAGKQAVVTNIFLDDVDIDKQEEVMLAIRDLDIADAKTLVGGSVAEVYDMNQVYLEAAPLAILIIVSSMIILLSLALRSIAISIQAIITNLLGLSVSVAIVVGVFQLGWFSGLTGWPEVEGIALIAPVLFATIAFGLAMDYSVFLFSRVREVYDETGDTKQAIVTGITKTGPIITAAALAFFVVVAGLAFSSTLMMQIIGIGLAIAVVVDAFFVRLVLVPAVMMLLGKSAWK